MPARLSARRVAAGFTFALSSVLSQAQQPQPVPAPDPRSLASIEGVTLGANRQPLSGTNVTLMGAARVPISGGGFFSPAYQATSDATGKFVFQDLPPGQYGFTADHADYSPSDIAIGRFVEDTLNGSSPGSTPNSVTVAAGQHLTNVELKLVPMTILSGQITDEDGNPMPGVTVRPMRADTVLNGHLSLTNAQPGVKTNVDGKYQLTVYTGRWYLSVTPPRPAHAKADDAAPEQPEQKYITTWYPGVTDMSLASGLDAAGQPVPELNVRLRRTRVFHVRGKISGPGDGDADPDLRILPSAETGSARPSIVDDGRPVKDDGTFDIADLTPGVWTLIVCKYGAPNSSSGRRTIRVTDRDLEDIAVLVQRPADLRGSLMTIPDQHEHGAAAAPTAARLPPEIPAVGAGFFMFPNTSVIVQLTPLEAMLNSPGVAVEPDGTFVMKGLEAGKYRVDVTPPPGGYVKSVTLNGLDSMDTGIDLNAGAASSGSLQIVVSMTAGELTGEVTNPDGGPPSAAIVTLIPDGPPAAVYRPDLNLVARTDAAGHFALKSIAPGTYRIYAWERLHQISDSVLSGSALIFPDPAFPRLFDSASSVVTLRENESKHVFLKLISAAKMDDEIRRR